MNLDDSCSQDSLGRADFCIIPLFFKIKKVRTYKLRDQTPHLVEIKLSTRYMATNNWAYLAFSMLSLDASTPPLAHHIQMVIVSYFL